MVAVLKHMEVFGFGLLVLWLDELGTLAALRLSEVLSGFAWNAWRRGGGG